MHIRSKWDNTSVVYGLQNACDSGRNEVLYDIIQCTYEAWWDMEFKGIWRYASGDEWYY